MSFKDGQTQSSYTIINYTKLILFVYKFSFLKSEFLLKRNFSKMINNKKTTKKIKYERKQEISV